MAFYQAVFRVTEGYGVVDLGIHPDRNSAILLGAKIARERREKGIEDQDVAIVQLVAKRNEFGELIEYPFNAV